jgi:hypothetical protein
MNSLSWFLYLAEALGTLGRLAGAFSVLGFFIFSAVCFWWLMWKVDGDKADIPKPPVKLVGGLWVFMLTLHVLVPSPDTIYLIAGSQAGEAVVTSEAGQEILNDIQEVIKYQLEQLKGGNR